jgi:hypothetical protein
MPTSKHPGSDGVIKTSTLLRTLAGLSASFVMSAALAPATAQTTGAPQVAPLLTEAAKGSVQQPSLKQHSTPQAKSAQGDCVREANRRGYSVIDTYNFQQSREGWSIDLRARDRRGRNVQGSCFVYTRTGDVSLYGFGWDDEWNGQNAMEFVCASVDSRYRECQLPVNGRARLVKKLSDARCVEGQSWGQQRDRVWVNNGCRARFEVTRSGGGGGGGGGTAGTIQCNSDNQRYRECQIGPGYTARLVREHSNRRCQRDSTWGTRNGIVWVTAGCRAEFQRVRGSGGGGTAGGSNAGGSNAGGMGSGTAAATALSSCLNEARRLNLRVEKHYAPRAVPGGYRMELRVMSKGGAPREATCVYSLSTGRARIDQMT